MTDSMEGLLREFNASQAQHRESGGGFNIVGLLGVNRSENAVSRGIAALLDPAGSHGQEKFLHAFLDTIGAETPAGARVASVEVEVPIDGNRRLDILLTFDNGLRIAIENKIDAGEQPDQLDDYCKWLKDGVMVFLTPDGRPPNSAGRFQSRCVCLSYEKLANCWEGLVGVPPSRLKEPIGQFVENLGEIGGKPMATSSEMKECLLERLETALAVREHLDDVEKEILNDFWKRCQKRIEEQIRDYQEWEVSGRIPECIRLSPKTGDYRMILELGNRKESPYVVISISDTEIPRQDQGRTRVLVGELREQWAEGRIRGNGQSGVKTNTVAWIDLADLEPQQLAVFKHEHYDQYLRKR